MKKCSYKFIFFITLLFSGLIAGAQSREIDSLRQLIPLKEGEDLAKVYLELSKSYVYVKPAEAIVYALKALALSKQSNSEEIECYASLLAGAGYIYCGDFDKGKSYVDEGLSLANKLDNTEYVCFGMNMLGAYYLSKGDYDKSMSVFKDVLSRAEAAGLKERVATIQMNIGSLLTSKGERTKGLRYLLEALKYFEKNGTPQIISRIFNNIAVNYHAWKDYDKALEYYEKTLKSYRTLNDVLGQVIVLNNIGEIYKDKNSYSKALEYYQQTIDLADRDEAGDYYKAYGWIGEAETYCLMKEDALALEKAGLALEGFQKAKMKEGIARSELIIGRAYILQKNYNEALKHLNRSAALAQNTGIIDLEQSVYRYKAEAYAGKRLYLEAYMMLREYTNLSDTLYKEEQMKELAQLRNELEITEKENEIELLQKDNQIKGLYIRKQEIQNRFLFLILGFLAILFVIMFGYLRSRKKANELLQEKNRRINEQHVELIRVNETKDKFLSIISHDLRNPVGAFKDVVGQLADFPEMFSDELRQQIINELREESENTYFLLDNLLSWARSQKNNMRYSPEQLQLASLVDNNILLNSRLAERKKISLIAVVPPDLFVYADHNMINLILRNLISNAVKFTGENGNITVSATDMGEFVGLSVTDSGIGIPEESIPKLFHETDHISTYGTNNEKGSGLGLLLCKEFVETNGGTISVKSALGKGSTFSFTLKKG